MESNNREDPSAEHVKYILPHALVSVNTLCQTNSLIITLEEQLESRVFDKVPFGIEWGRLRVDAAYRHEKREEKEEDAGSDDEGVDAEELAEAIFPAILNTPEYLQPTRRILVELRRLLRRFGFACIWYFKRAAMDEWWANYLHSNASQRKVLGMPFGVVQPDEALFSRAPLDMRRYGPLKTRLQVEHMTDPEGKHYHYSIFCDNEVLLATPATQWARAAEAKAPVGGGGTLARLYQQGMAGGRERSLVPTSEFYDLCDHWAALQEIRRNHKSAESLATTPIMITQAESLSLKDTSVEVAPPGEHFAPHNIIEERANQAQQIQMYTMSQWMAATEQEQDLMAEFTGRAPDQLSVSEQQRRQYGRPSATENVKKLWPGMRLAYMSKPFVIHNLDVEEQRFRIAVANAMKVPLVLLEGGAVGKGSRVGSENQDFMGGRTSESTEEKALDATIARERSLYERLFQHVYTVTMGPIDVAALSTTVSILEARLAHQVEAHDYAERLAMVLATNAPEKQPRKGQKKRTKKKSREKNDEAGEAEKEGEAEEEEEESSSATGGAADDVNEEEEEQLKQLVAARAAAGTNQQRAVTRRAMRHARLFLALLRDGGSSCARMVFQPGITATAMGDLTGLLHLFQAGLIGAEGLQPHVEKLWPGTIVREDPMKTIARQAEELNLKSKELQIKLQQQQLQAGPAENNNRGASKKTKAPAESSPRPAKKARREKD